MHTRKFTVSLVTILLFSVITTSLISITNGETISTTEKWTESREVSEDITIKPGAQLTIEDGVSIEITADITITVEGTLIISGTSIAGVNITGNIPQSSEGGSLGMWQGIVVQSGGVLTVDYTTISNAVNTIEVQAGASSSLDNLQLNDSVNGLLNAGTTTLTSSLCENIQSNCIDNSGSITVTGVSASDSGKFVSNSGDGTFTGLDAYSVGVAINSASGATGTFSDVSTNDTGLVLRVQGTQSGTTFTDFDVLNSDLLIDATNSTHLSIDNIQGAMIDSILLADDADLLSVSDSEISGINSPYIAIRANTGGAIELADVEISGHSQTFLLTGGGMHLFDNSTFAAAGKVGQVSSSTTLTAIEGAWFGGTDGLDLQHSTAWLQNLNISVEEGHGTAIRVLAGILDMHGEVNLSHGFAWGDSTSIGIQSIWSDVDGETVTVSGFHTGVRCETTSELTFITLSITDIRSTGYEQACSSTVIETLETTYGNHGLVSDEGSISISTWNAESHTVAMLLSNENANTYLRDWSGTDYIFAAQGDANEFFYGTDDISSNSIQLTDDVAEIYTETNIEVTDLSGGNVLENVEVNVHGFTDISDASGLVTLPLADVNINVIAFDQSQAIGREKPLSTTDLTPRIELPVLPDDGSDWVINNGVSIVLDRFTGSISSHIIVESGGSLTLVETILYADSLAVESGGVLTGTSSSINAEMFWLNSTSIGSVGAWLELDGSTEVDCSLSSFTWTGVYFLADVNLNTVSDCIIYLFGGGVDGNVNIAAGGSIAQFSDLHVSVLDEGEPISGAIVSLNDVRDVNEVTSATTDASGVADLVAQGLTYDETGLIGGFDVGRTVSMQITASGISQNQYWDASSSSETTFIASTLQNDEVTNYRSLDNEWSPYYLFDDLVVSGLMEIENGVDLQISSSVDITIEGILNAGEASLHGSDWSGLIVDGGNINLEGTYLLNAIQSITLINSASAELSNVTLYNSVDGHLMLSSGSSANVVDSSLILGDNCVRTSNDEEISLNIDSTNISMCNLGLRVTGAHVNLNDLIMYTPGAGIRVIDVSGSMTNLTIDGDFTIFNGSDNPPLNIISDSSGLEILDQTKELLISDIDIDIQSTAISIEDSAGITVESVIATNIHLTRSTLTLMDTSTSSLLISGTRSANHLYINNLSANFLNGSTISSHQCVQIINSLIDAINLQDLCMSVQDSSFGNLITTFQATTSYVELVDSTVDSVIVNGNGTVYHNQTHTIEHTLFGNSVSPFFRITPLLPSNSENNPHHAGTSLVDTTTIAVTWRVDDNGGMVIYLNHTVSTNPISITIDDSTVHSLPTENTITAGPGAVTSHSFELQENIPPVVSITMPEGLTTIEQGATTTPSGAPNQIIISASDEHGIESVTGTIVNLDTDETIQISGSGAINLSVLNEGDQLLTVMVFDEHGAYSTVAKTFTITAPDADDDNIETCDPSNWYDDVEQRMCGPDDADLDDDNDGLRDEVDAFPYDACATLDTDGDGLPDEIKEGCTTPLEEDEDDDGNGVPDSQDAAISSQGSGSSSQFMTVLSIILLLIIGGAAVRRFKQFEG